MKALLLKSYLGNAAGSLVDWEPGVVDLLVMRGIAELIEEKHVAAPPANKAMQAAPATKQLAPRGRR